MKVSMRAFLALLLLGSGYAAAQGFPATSTSQAAQPAQPSSPEPQDLPPPPPQELPPAPQEQVQVAQQQPAAMGQWIFTAQYGWVWMPYGSEYVAPATIAGYAPYAYVYHPFDGWVWLAAPWVYGWGVSPHFGSHGPAAFAWYHPSFWGGHRWGHIRGGVRHDSRHVGGGHFPGVPAPHIRGGGGHSGSGHIGGSQWGGGHRGGGHRSSGHVGGSHGSGHRGGGHRGHG